jgi:AcrR family transcriptional regulator
MAGFARISVIPERQHTVAEIAEAVGVHRTTVYDYLKKES